MLTRTLIALTLAGPPKTQAPTCTLAGPPIQARWSGTIPPAPAAVAPLRVVADVPLPGSASRFDYQSLEPASGRLFISHMGAGQLVVFDVRAGRVIRNLDGFPTVTGVLAAPAEHRAYASATGAHAVIVVDDSTLGIVARVPGPRFPDGIAYAPEERRVFVSDESGRRDFVIDARTNSVVTQIELDGEAGNTVRPRLALRNRRRPDREPTGGHRSGERHHRSSHHARPRGPVPPWRLHRRGAPPSVCRWSGKRDARRAGSPDAPAASGAPNRERSRRPRIRSDTRAAVRGRRVRGRGRVRGPGPIALGARLVPGAEGALGGGRSRHAPRLPAARGRERPSGPPGVGAERFPLSNCGRSQWNEPVDSP